MPRLVPSRRSLVRFLRAGLVPLLVAGLGYFALREPIRFWVEGNVRFDQEAIQEWIREANVYKPLPELIRENLKMIEEFRKLDAQSSSSERGSIEGRLERKRQEILEHLKAIGNPPTKVYPNQLPLFPVIYRLTIEFDAGLNQKPIVWDSELPRQPSQYQVLKVPLDVQAGPAAAAEVTVQYHLHAFQQRQAQELERRRRNVWLFGLALAFSLLALGWVYLAQRREDERQHRQLLAEQQLHQAAKLRLEEELRREEAERNHQEAEKQNLELKSQIFANIGIMAGSYAHNIKNLLVRPNDLLRRCLEEPLPGEEQRHLVQEVRETLSTVTERLQQILQTVRRDPGKAEKVRLNLNLLAEDLFRSWSDLAREKWKMFLSLETDPEPLWVEGDHSHLQQTLENLLFNARDATFEMRNHLREQARARNPGAVPDRQALMAAVGWKGQVALRTRREGNWAVIEIQDNGIGMAEEVRRRCTEAHFSTKRNNALFAGLSAGMGLGLSFVLVILNHHGGKLEVESQPLEGAKFRVLIPLAGQRET